MNASNDFDAAQPELAPEPNQAPNQEPNLPNTWGQLLQKIGGYGNWQKDPAMQKTIHQALNQFERHPNRIEHTDMVMYSLARGCSLIKAALEWEQPYAGKVPTSPQDTARMRGLQWRLVMSYNAFELVCVALMQPSQTLTPELIKDFVQKCNLPALPTPILSPGQERANFQKWLGQAPGAGAKGSAGKGTALLNFLGLRKGDRRIFEQWAIAAKPVQNWDQTVLLAKALRNVSAHGSLSATKIRELGLRQSFETLPPLLAEVIEAAIGKLV